MEYVTIEFEDLVVEAEIIHRDRDDNSVIKCRDKEGKVFTITMWYED